MDISTIVKNIAEIRKKAGLTQDELAEKLSVSPQAVSKWENGHNLPDLENLLHIAEISNTPYSALFKSSGDTANYVLRDRLFKEENMYTRMKTIALSASPFQKV